MRARLEAQARLTQESREQVETKHSDLIQAAINHYVPHFLPGYRIIYVDEADGDRISQDEQKKLEEAGVSIGLADAMPDVLLWHPQSDHLWVIEAVTSDGEVDYHKFQQMLAFATRHNKSGVSFTTAYPSWRIAASRQSKHKNIYPGTYIWIREDPTKQLFVSAGTSDATQ